MASSKNTASGLLGVIFIHILYVSCSLRFDLYPVYIKHLPFFICLPPFTHRSLSLSTSFLRSRSILGSFPINLHTFLFWKTYVYISTLSYPYVMFVTMHITSLYAYYVQHSVFLCLSLYFQVYSMYYSRVYGHQKELCLFVYFSCPSLSLSRAFTVYSIPVPLSFHLCPILILFTLLEVLFLDVFMECHDPQTGV